MSPVIVIGAGGHALVLLDALAANKREVLGLVDNDTSLHGGTLLGFPILGGDDALGRYDRGSVELVNAIGSASVRRLERRRRVYEALVAQGHAFASVVHPSAVVSRHAVLARGTQVMAGAVVQAQASIGENSIVNTRASIDHGCRIGSHVHVAPGVTLSGDVTVGDETHLGVGATVVQGVRIGMRCMVNAGAVAKNNLADGERLR
jgi:UDP-perosamine 4-acetyltransferase